MKRIGTAIIIACLVFIGLYVYNEYLSRQSVSNSEFQKVHSQLRNEIDTINMKLDSINSKLVDMEANQDSLKAGQVIIYRHVKNTDDKSFLDNLIDFFER
jgi:peptidoglycan hydrolase CwlO-like protein